MPRKTPPSETPSFKPRLSRATSEPPELAQPDEHSDEVGYGNPPRHTRFAPGVSGNPRGRPKGAKNKLPVTWRSKLGDMMLDEAYRLIPVNEGGNAGKMPILQAVIRGVAVKAAKGDHRSAKLLMDGVAAIQKVKQDGNDRLLEKAIDYKRNEEAKIAYHQRRNLPVPERLPHPDDVIIDVYRGAVDIIGPMTKEEKKDWHEYAELRTNSRRNIVDIRAEMKKERSEERRQELMKELREFEFVAKGIDFIIGSWPERPLKFPARNLARPQRPN